MMKTTAELFILAVRARGSDATSVRDAAHEAHHAIEAMVPDGKWSRMAISKAVKLMGPSDAAASEIIARAVEQHVCRQFGVEVKPLKEYALISCMEAMKFGESFLNYNQALEAMQRMHDSKHVMQHVQAVLALMEKTPLKTRARKQKP